MVIIPAGATIVRARGREVLHAGVWRPRGFRHAIGADSANAAGEAVLNAAATLTCCHTGAHIIVSAEIIAVAVGAVATAAVLCTVGIP